MTTQVLPQNAIQDTINSMLSTNKPLPPTDYRYYHCHLDWNGLKCKRVEGPSTMSTNEWTKLLFVKSYIPQMFDKHILKYQWMPDRVIIEDK
jgi:hypothetical protein